MYRIGSRARLLLEDTSHTPRVHSVFRNAVNIGCGEDYLITILPEAFGCGPLAITLSTEDYNRLKSALSAEGTVFTGGMLETFGNGQVEYFSLPESLDGLDETTVRHSLGICRQQLASSERHEGAAAYILGLESIYNSKFAAAASIIGEAISRRDSFSLAEGASSIVGFGPGLTPSGDDFLYGLFAALFYASRYRKLEIDWIRSAVELVIPGSKQKTTVISYNMLRTCLDAEFNEYIIRLLLHIFCGPQQELKPSCSKVLSIGSSSGSDMLAGVIYGLEALI